MSSIGRGFNRDSSSIYPLLLRTGGIRPPERKRSRLALTLPEREEISRGLTACVSMRSIACRLGLSPSTINQEIKRKGGTSHYRAASSDQSAWDRSRRPKLHKLACHQSLYQTVVGKLHRHWSPEQIASWLKRKYLGS
ncbi:IS30 family transposase [Parasphingorhabdus cellanae]|uniref:IS30 family transposase n=1 Tax=Parasphingorhabdus cellanae TaxID=2806553 RepID=A0ABX7T5S1_9SPHN|nr:helix-turn-helix domain-containing protein [Parasphingorhabdus cellanae]QTD55862.1 IS30 family transposase [Parasphingorhabdus cellanae]